MTNMRKLIVIIIAIAFAGCHKAPKVEIEELNRRIDSLQTAISKAYKPHFGDLMSKIQIQHEKLYFAGQHENWTLADFQLEEMEEVVEDAQDFHSHKEKGQLIEMIEAPMDSVAKAIEQKDLNSFNQQYDLLTNTCIACHKATGHTYIQIRIPTAPAFSNQIFEKVK